MPGAPKAPANCYWRGDTLWANIKIRGTRYRTSLRTSDAREAKKRLAEWRKELEGELAKPPRDERRTYKEAVVRWLGQHLPRQVKPSVVERCQVSARAMDPLFNDLYLDEIDQKQIARLVEHRMLTVTNTTIRRDLSALSQLLAAARSWGWVENNPMRDFDLGQVRERRDPIILPEPDDIKRVLDAAPPLMANVLSLLEATGMRENEAAWLKQTAIDWQARTITLLHTKTNRPRSIHWATPGGDAGPVLSSLRLREDTPYVFPLDGEMEPYQNFSSNFGRVIRAVVVKCERRGIPFRRFRVHDLRHLFAVRALKRGMGIYDLQQHLGHRSVTTTEIYLDYTPADVQARARAGVPQKVPHSRVVPHLAFETFSSDQ